MEKLILGKAFDEKSVAEVCNDLIIENEKLRTAVKYLAAYVGEKPNERINQILE